MKDYHDMTISLLVLTSPTHERWPGWVDLGRWLHMKWFNNYLLDCKLSKIRFIPMSNFTKQITRDHNTNLQGIKLSCHVRGSHRVSRSSWLLRRVKVIGANVVLVRRWKLNSTFLEVMERTTWKQQTPPDNNCRQTVLCHVDYETDIWMYWVTTIVDRTQLICQRSMFPARLLDRSSSETAQCSTEPPNQV